MKRAADGNRAAAAAAAGAEAGAGQGGSGAGGFRRRKRRTMRRVGRDVEVEAALLRGTVATEQMMSSAGVSVGRDRLYTEVQCRAATWGQIVSAGVQRAVQKAKQQRKRRQNEGGEEEDQEEQEEQENAGVACGVHVLVLCASGRRAMDLCRQLSALRHRVLKLFAKHLKMEEQITLLQQAAPAAPVGVGTPARIRALLEAGALRLDKTELLLLDVFPDSKSFTVLTLRDVARDTAQLVMRAVEGENRTRVGCVGPLPQREAAGEEEEQKQEPT